MDCFDTCQAELRDGKIKGSKEHKITNGKLCANFAYLLKEERCEKSLYKDKEISLEESLSILSKKLKETEASDVLYYKGSGNLGVMQGFPKSFFSEYGATFTKGSLCEGAGQEGLTQGRGFCINPSDENLLNSDVIVVWGRNLTVTSSHMYNLIKDKTFITIDPMKTKIAKKSDVFLQLNPKTDHDLALLMTRLAYMEDMEDEENFSSYSTGADWFFDLAKSKPLVSYEKTTGVSLQEVMKAVSLMKGKSVAFLLGLGAQKYYEGAQIMRTIDSFAAYIGAHNKDKGGLWYLGDSSYGYEKQFISKPKKEVDIVSVDFSSFKLVFIQGANPVVSAPNTKRLIEGLEKTFVVYFGTTYNDTCKYADLVIPSTNFLAKKDLRLSYGHDLKAISQIVEQKNENTISEYELAAYLRKEFLYEDLKSEDDILEYYEKTIINKPKIEAFKFIEELEIENLYEKKDVNNFYFITSKQANTLNSQFKVDNYLYINSCNKFEENKKVLLKSSHGQASFIIKYDDNVKSNCVLVYAGAKNANYLTPATSDEVSCSAIFQDILVSIELY